jgi:hypothetical protein
MSCFQIYGNKFLTVKNQKFFDAAIFQKCCRGQGRTPPSLIKISEKHALKMFRWNIFKVPIDKN